MYLWSIFYLVYFLPQANIRSNPACEGGAARCGTEEGAFFSGSSQDFHLGSPEPLVSIMSSQVGRSKRALEEISSPRDVLPPTSERIKSGPSRFSPQVWDSLSTIPIVPRALRKLDSRKADGVCNSRASARRPITTRRLLRSDAPGLRDIVRKGGFDLSVLCGVSLLLHSHDKMITVADLTRSTHPSAPCPDLACRKQYGRVIAFLEEDNQIAESLAMLNKYNLGAVTSRRNDSPGPGKVQAQSAQHKAVHWSSQESQPSSQQRPKSPANSRDSGIDHDFEEVIDKFARMKLDALSLGSLLKTANYSHAQFAEIVSRAACHTLTVHVTVSNP